MATQLETIAGYLNARQEVINSGRADQKADYIANASEKSGTYVTVTNNFKDKFINSNNSIAAADVEAKLSISSSFADMVERASTLVKTEGEELETSFAEAKLALDIEEASLAKSITSAVQAIDDLDADARQNFGFSELPAAVATIENALSGSSFV